MESTRQQKVERMIQKQLATLFQQEGKPVYGGALITVTKVHVAKDLAIARIYLSLFATKDKNALFTKIQSRTREIRGYLGNHLKNQLRVIPSLEFYIDDSLDYIENIDRLLKT